MLPKEMLRHGPLYGIRIFWEISLAHEMQKRQEIFYCKGMAMHDNVERCGPEKYQITIELIDEG